MKSDGDSIQCRLKHTGELVMVMTGIYDVKTWNEMSKDWCLLTLVAGYILDHSDVKGSLRISSNIYEFVTAKESHGCHW